MSQGRDQLKAQIAAVSKSRPSSRGDPKPENAEVRSAASSEYAADCKGISWTRILGDLEKIMPPNVKMLNIQPYVTGQNQITLNLQVGSESGEPVIEFYRALESSKLFDILGQPIFNPPSQAEPLYRYRITVNYAQKL